MFGVPKMKRFGGFRRGTRGKYKKQYRKRGKFAIAEFVKTFSIGDRVALGVESSYHKGLYHPRFFGRVGKISGKKGKCYEVAIVDQHKEKTLLVHPVHLKRL